MTTNLIVEQQRPIFLAARFTLSRKDMKEAESLITKFLELYPSSSYTDEMRMMYGKLNLQQEDYYGALRELAFQIGRASCRERV